ncbi:MAG: hypothetical protein RL189_2545 [Pseudomonadota bacterium]|jgi:hypothetical protein
MTQKNKKYDSVRIGYGACYYFVRALKALIIVTSIVFSKNSLAAQGDTTFTQRAGYVQSKGNLSRDAHHIGLHFTASRTYHGPMKYLGAEMMHRFSVLYDTFYTLGPETLLFPVLPHAQTRIVEPSLHLELCLFTTKRMRPCVGGGFAAVYLQSSIQNYQLYAAFPIEARLAWYSPESFYFFEAGARMRSFQNRIEGYVAKHTDVMPFVGIGLFFAGEAM